MSMKAVLVEQVTEGDSRRSERRALRLEARSASRSAGAVQVVIHNISSTGLLIEAPEDILSVGESVVVEIPQRGPVELRVIWKGDRYLGCEFQEPLPKAAISAALLQGDPVSAESSPLGALSSTTGAFSSRKLWPELNFSVATAVTIAMWALIVALAGLVFG